MRFVVKNNKLMEVKTNIVLTQPAFIVNLEKYHLVKIGEAQALREFLEKLTKEHVYIYMELDTELFTLEECASILNRMLFNKKDTRFQVLTLIRKGAEYHESKQKKFLQ